ncbi:MAG: protein-L-isoaspartate O-methyltransferase [Gammaproteobacteria bacterium]|nr:protein-L-isoaspartate O-methyltransferase [Gammaproteobacteria bacterium]
MNLEQARFNMIEQQVRPWDVLNPEVLNVLSSTPRDEFVPAEFCNLAYSDTEIPLSHGQIMMKPVVEGRILQHIQLKASDIVLEVGTGSGYLTACMAKLAGHVYSIDVEADLTQSAQANLKQHGIDNVTLETGDAAHGWNNKPSYDVIVLTGSVSEHPEQYKQQLAKGGRLFVIIGENKNPIMEALLIQRDKDGEYHTQSLFETHIPALKHTEKAAVFNF